MNNIANHPYQTDLTDYFIGNEILVDVFNEEMEFLTEEESNKNLNERLSEIANDLMKNNQNLESAEKLQKKIKKIQLRGKLKYEKNKEKKI